MFALTAIVGVAAVVLAWLLLAPVLRASRRRRAAARPLDPFAAQAIERHPVSARLPPELRTRLAGLVQAFLAEKSFVGCNGLVVTDEVRATIAAQACLLLLGRPGSLYDELRSILVYPTAFWVDEEHQDEDGLVTRRREVLSGQAWDSSRIILAWEDISPAQTDTDPGYNVVLHEFAHYLDAEGRGLAPATDGSRIRDVADWSADLADEFDRMVAAVESGRNTFLDPYAAEDEAEFFAVASEEFLERPAELRSDHPALYALLREYYALDPASWTAYAAD